MVLKWTASFSWLATAALTTTSTHQNQVTGFGFPSIGTTTTKTTVKTLTNQPRRRRQLSNNYLIQTALKSTEEDSAEESAAPGLPPKLTKEQEDALQWDLFTKHHARGKWRGTWMTYNYMGDVVDTTNASVNLEYDPNTNSVQHTHDIAMSSTSSDCKTCFSSTNIKTFPVATYTPGNLSNYRCASTSMVCGPSLLRSGAMSTELILNFGEGRVRAIYQHAPVWEDGVEPGSCPPQALKLFRVVVSREVLEKSDGDEEGSVGPPTAESEREKEPERGNPKFFRPIPPFFWHKKWAGTSWTWGPQTGDRGWEIQDLSEADAWHGRPTGDTSDIWAMRLPGGILLQCPRIITSGFAGLCRLAWLPEDDGAVGTEADGDPAKLLRVEASVMALEPVIDEEEDVMLGFYPPELGSVRCDVLMKVGELENTSMLEKLRNLGETDNDTEGDMTPKDDTQIATEEKEEKKKKENKIESNKKGGEDGNEPLDDSGLDAVRNALKL